MTGNRTGMRAGNVRNLRSTYNSQDMARMREAIDAVCGELGITDGSTAEREAVARRIMAAYDTGRRQPLNLVNAGLGEFELTA